MDRQHVAHYWQLVGKSYDLGLLTFLVGLVLLLVPREWNVPTSLAFAVGSLALAIEVRWTVGTWLPRLRWNRVIKPFDTALKPVRLEPLDEVSACAVLDEEHRRAAASSPPAARGDPSAGGASSDAQSAHTSTV